MARQSAAKTIADLQERGYVAQQLAGADAWRSHVPTSWPGTSVLPVVEGLAALA